MSQKQPFTLGHRKFLLDRETVEYKLATIKPDRIKKVYARIGKKNFPPIQALAESVPGLVRSQIKTQEAVRVLTKLEFPVKEKKPKEEK